MQTKQIISGFSYISSAHHPEQMDSGQSASGISPLQHNSETRQAQLKFSIYSTVRVHNSDAQRYPEWQQCCHHRRHKLSCKFTSVSSLRNSIKPSLKLRFLYTTCHKIGHFENVLPSQSLGLALKLNLVQQKQSFIHNIKIQHPFNGPLSGTTRVSRYQKGKTNLDFTEAKDGGWQWHQLDHMQVCTSL